jgi:hypothetical protein
MKIFSRIKDWWRWRNRRHLHPCDVCYKMMYANGYGICDSCVDAFYSDDDAILKIRIELAKMGEKDGCFY